MIRFASIVTVIAALGGLFLFGLNRGAPDRNIRSNYLGKPVPEFSLPSYERYASEYGDIFDVSDHIGKPMIINFWSPTCPPCYDEAPELERTWQKYQDEVLIIGIHTRDSGLEGGNAFLDQFNITFPNVFDEQRRLMIDYGLFGLPETFFVNKEGELVYKHVGQINETFLERQIETLF